MSETHDTEGSSRAGSRLAALAHFGMPIGGPLLPLVLHFWKRETSPDIVRHCNQAFVFQCAVLVPYTVLSVSSSLGSVSYRWFLGFIVLVMTFQLLNAWRALNHGDPVRLVERPLLPAADIRDGR